MPYLTSNSDHDVNSEIYMQVAQDFISHNVNN